MQIRSHNPMPNTLQAPVSVHLIPLFLFFFTLFHVVTCKGYYRLFKLFQEEKPVWYTINCNPLPKDYKQPKMEDDVVHEHDIAMATDKSSSSVSEEYAT
ncbi:hypothetical protein HanPI659440_Chr03g0101991 [Helianthus annuus]|nr:hypothetical protein HanPI659440_Chr03g0101991 [Helianthus annuus]